MQINLNSNANTKNKKPLKNTQIENKNTNKNLFPLTQYHKDSLGYEVKVFLDDNFNICAGVIDANNNFKALSSDKIYNALTNKTLTKEEAFALLKHGAQFFIPVYNPQKNLVTIWPKLEAAAVFKFTLFNPFVGKTFTEIADMLRAKKDKQGFYLYDYAREPVKNPNDESIIIRASLQKKQHFHFENDFNCKAKLAA